MRINAECASYGLDCILLHILTLRSPYPCEKTLFEIVFCLNYAFAGKERPEFVTLRAGIE